MGVSDISAERTNEGPKKEVPKGKASETRLKGITGYKPLIETPINNTEHLDRAVSKIQGIFDQEKARRFGIDQDLEAALSEIPGEMSENVTRALFKIWADDYDPHMQDHVNAICSLLLKVISLQKRNERIFKGKILEETVGTAAILDLISRLVGAKTARKLEYVANDLTPEMHDKAREKLAALPYNRRPASVEYTYEDIRRFTFEPETFDTAILSQTLHLITDFAGEGNVYGDKHTQIKAEVLQKTFQMLKKGGHFLLFDEWPAILTRREGMELIDELFGRTFEPIPDRDIFRRMMQGIRGARVVAELKARIDADHNMYMYIYRKDSDKLNHRGRYYLDTVGRQKSRKKAALEVIKRFVETDDIFVESFAREKQEGYVDFKPLRQMSYMSIDDPNFKFTKSEKYDAIVIRRVLHDMRDDIRQRMIRSAIESLRMGGVLLFVDEWHPPMKSQFEQSKRYPIGKSALRGHLNSFFQRCLMFEGLHRVAIKPGYDNGMWAIGYRKVR
ncbi:class I SAM-dependent methyltransferase [Candidatus Micrarchaeota archaeon]|nr:class I SAM-dependent methyltransferase [Candidatus Micrarchaeota archaeon]